jgi:coenzyme Q-binding protein COQ10
MPVFASSRSLAYDMESLYRIVMDVECYPKILPYIRSISIEERGDHHMIASVCVGIKPLAFSYRCHIQLEPPHAIYIHALPGGPFSRLEASWKFEPAGKDHTLVKYALDYAFHNPLMEAIAGRIFKKQFEDSLRVFEAHLSTAARR